MSEDIKSEGAPLVGNIDDDDVKTRRCCGCMTIGTFNVVWCGLCFLFLFGSFNPIQSLQTSLPTNPARASYGFIGIAVLYGSFSVASLFASQFVRLVGQRLGLFLGALCYLLYIGTLLILALVTSLSDSSYAALYFTASSVIGIGASVLWTSQGSLLAVMAEKSNLGALNGIFWSLFMVSYIFGGLITEFVLKRYEQSKLICCCICLFNFVLKARLVLFCTLCFPLWQAWPCWVCCCCGQHRPCLPPIVRPAWSVLISWKRFEFCLSADFDCFYLPCAILAFQPASIRRSTRHILGRIGWDSRWWCMAAWKCWARWLEDVFPIAWVELLCSWSAVCAHLRACWSPACHRKLCQNWRTERGCTFWRLLSSDWVTADSTRRCKVRWVIS
jgi:MFS family permease